MRYKNYIGTCKVGLTLTLASVRLVQAAISSLVAMSGYLFRWNVASSSCSCWLVKCVRCRRCRFGFLSPATTPPPPLASTSSVVDRPLMMHVSSVYTSNNVESHNDHPMIRRMIKWYEYISLFIRKKHDSNQANENKMKNSKEEQNLLTRILAILHTSEF